MQPLKIIIQIYYSNTKIFIIQGKFFKIQFIELPQPDKSHPFILIHSYSWIRSFFFFFSCGSEYYQTPVIEASSTGVSENPAINIAHFRHSAVQKIIF